MQTRHQLAAAALAAGRASRAILRRRDRRGVADELELVLVRERRAVLAEQRDLGTRPDGLGVEREAVVVEDDGRGEAHAASSPSAASTSSSWVFGAAFGITWRTTPSGSIRNVARCVPQ